MLMSTFAGLPEFRSIVAGLIPDFLNRVCVRLKEQRRRQSDTLLGDSAATSAVVVRADCCPRAKLRIAHLGGRMSGRLPKAPRASERLLPSTLPRKHTTVELRSNESSM